MESKRSMGNITLEEGYAETKLADSETGYKMSIPVCNAVIPPCWRNTVLKVAEAFMYAYDESQISTTLGRDFRARLIKW